MKKNVLIVVLALLVVGGGGFIAGDKLGKKNSTPETTVESTTVENATAEAIEKVVGSAVDERVDEAPVTNAAVANKEVVVDEKVTYVTGNKTEPEVKVTVPAEKVTVKEPVVATETVKPVEKVTVKAPVVVTEAKNSAEKISREKAKSIALNHAGVKEADVRELEIELDKEKGVLVYEVSFESGKYDYEYHIDAVTGAVKFSEKESENDARGNKTETKAETTTNSVEKISREKAKSIALNHAGLKEADVRELEIELDNEKGVYVYEVSFKSGRYEYDYVIDAVTGAIKLSEKDFDD